MWGVWILMLACISLGASQDHNTEYVDYDYVDVAAQETHSRSRASAPVHQQLKPRRPVTGKKTKPLGTTPVPILVDIRRVDPHTGAFYYHYAGGDGSMKHEVRFPNGTVIGNFTYVKENGELETNTYHHGGGTNIIDNDDGSYDHHRHLEEAYVHQSGPDPVEELFPEYEYLQPNSVRVQSQSRPFAAQQRPVTRNRVRVQSRPRPIVQEQVPSAFSAPQPVPLDYHDSQTAFSFQDESRQNFNPNAVDDHQAQASSTAFSFQDESRQNFNPNAVDDHQAKASYLQNFNHNAVDDHQAQASSLQPVVEVADYDHYEYIPQSRDQQLVPVAVSEQ